MTCSDQRSVAAALNRAKGAVVSCTRCLAQGLTCGNQGACKNCAGYSKPCKRAMCKRYEGIKCTNKTCTFAHEGDDFARLVLYTRTKSEEDSRVHAKVVKAQRSSVKIIRGEKRTAERRYDKLFRHVAKKRKMDDDDNDDVDTATN